MPEGLIPIFVDFFVLLQSDSAITRAGYVNNVAHLFGLLNNYNVGSVVDHLLVRLDSEIPQNLYIRVFHHWFWGVLIPLISTVNSIVLTKVPMDTFGHVVMMALVFCLN